MSDFLTLDSSDAGKYYEIPVNVMVKVNTDGNGYDLSPDKIEAIIPDDSNVTIQAISQKKKRGDRNLTEVGASTAHTSVSGSSDGSSGGSSKGGKSRRKRKSKKARKGKSLRRK